MTNYIAVINAGSSSVKFAIYEASNDELCLFRGQVEGIGVSPHLKVTDDAGRSSRSRTSPHKGSITAPPCGRSSRSDARC